MNLLDHLSSWSADELGRLIAARPDLLSATDRGLEAVARKAATALSLGRALVGADVGMLVVAEAVVTRHPATVAEIDALLGTDDPVGVLDAVERLRQAGVVVVADGLISPVGALADLLHRPLGLGPSFVELADGVAPDTLQALAERTRACGGANRSATVRAVGHRLAQPEVLAELLADAPAETRELFESLVASRSPAIPLPTGYPYRGLEPGDPMAWLLDNGLVVAVTESGAELPRELVLAARPDGLAPAARLRSVELQPVEGLAAEVVEGRAADAANLLLDRAETILRLVERGEVSLRKAGGVGPRELARVAKTVGADAVTVGRTLELLAVARLVAVGGGRLAPSDLAARWWSLARHRRYLVLARAWLAAERFLSRGLSVGDPGKLVALGDSEPLAAVTAARRAVLHALCELEPGSAADPDQLAEAVVWQGPNLWGTGEPPPETLVAWVVAEAGFLGIAADDAPAPVGRALSAGDEQDTVRATVAALGEDQDTFVLQNDLTAVAFGPLSPGVARALGDMTERAPGGDDARAPTFRFTESSLRTALDRGWDVTSITGFLTEHALAGVPQPLEYLLGDVERRYGTLRVLPAQSVIVTGDEVAAVEIAAERRAASLGLRLVAPTVLTSPLDPVTVVETLRRLGRFPTLDGSSVVIDQPGAAPGQGEGRSPGEPAADLPADWTGPPLPTGPFPDEIEDAVALLVTARDGSPEADRVPASGVARSLQAWWGRSVVLDTGGQHGRRGSVQGIVVGLGTEVALLTPSGVVEVPIDTIVSVADPAGR